MVGSSVLLLVRTRGPDEFWRKRKIFKLAAVNLFFIFCKFTQDSIEILQHYRGRSRNVYSLAVRNVHRALVYATKGRRLKKADLSAV